MMGATGLFDSAMNLCISTPIPVGAQKKGYSQSAFCSGRPVQAPKQHSPSKQPSKIPHMIPDPIAPFGPA